MDCIMGDVDFLVSHDHLGIAGPEGPAAVGFLHGDRSWQRERSVKKVRKKLPIGIDGFEKIRTNDFYYADKTLFIKELLQNWGEVNLFTRPRRFGKSLNMSMLKCFFEIGGTPELFDGLKIMQEEDLCAEYMGKFPVISISLKSAGGLTYKAASDALRTVIGNESKRFRVLLESPSLDEKDKTAYERLIDVDRRSDASYAMSDAVLIDSLNILSRLLMQHYGQKVILLIDEYAVPLDKAFQRGYYDEMVNLIRSLFDNALKTNDSLYFAVLTGGLRISKESIFTGLNNLNVMTISDPYFCDSFGFTEDEVTKLLDYYGLNRFHDTVRTWYDGYQFGNTSVYCPWDVIKYTQILLKDKEAEPENYWANTSGNDLIRNLLKKANQSTKNEVEQLINGGTITKIIRQELTYREVEDSIDNIWNVLYSTGYLTCRRRIPGRQMELVLPNREVRELFIDLVKDWFEEMTQANSDRINHFCAAFPAEDAATIQKMLGDYLWDSIRVRDTAVRTNMKENFYHGMLLGLLRSQGNWLVKSNAETGEGYSDISIQTLSRIGIVIEKKYTESLKRQGMKKIIQYGIAFWEKECMVVIAS